MIETLFPLVEHTNRSIFLTGKAGTGKTTFLNDFVKKTKKKHIVVAPTGIAAINAGGVTIHSMFGLPLRPFVPTVERINQNLANNISDLVHHFKYRKDKIKLLREVEIIIIDEVSMLRADLLDMMDFALRHIRRNQNKFGGVQMLFIGDLYQLPPVVREENEYILKQFYKSPFFFDAKSLENHPLVTIELTEVFRQKDENFLEILNAIRDGNREDIDFEKINQQYNPNFEAEDEAYVYLCSHNRMADEINQKKLKELKNPSFNFRAIVEGDFRENQFPNDEVLELKIGAQVMFIRNDTSSDKKYYNGKLAEISHLSEDEVVVILEGTEEEISIQRETWENKKYALDEQKNIFEEVLGSFQQFPLRLAWAVTIHKSQGLTFDRLIIDAGKSFASGQVYVALSRCRTLEGIVLKSKITPEVIFNDERISQFQEITNANDRIQEIIETEKYDYGIQKVLRKLDCRWFSASLEQWNLAVKESKTLDFLKAQALYLSLKNEILNFIEIETKFEKIMILKTAAYLRKETDWNGIEDKAKAAVSFFYKNIFEKIFQPLKDFYAETKGAKGLKAYNEEMKTFLDDVEEYLLELKEVHLLETPLFNKEEEIQVSSKVKKIPTHIITYQMFEEGKTVNQIAKDRGLVNSTIFGHLAKFAEQGILDLQRIFTPEKITIFEKVFQENYQTELNEWKRVLPSDFEYHEIRILINHYHFIKNKNKPKE